MEFMMDSSGRDILGNVTHSGKMAILEGSSQESVKNSIDSNSERLPDEGKRSLSKGKAKVHDMPPTSPPNAKRLFQRLISGEFCQDNTGDKNKETDHSRVSSLFFGLIPGHCNESEDVSTEGVSSLSTEALEEKYKKDSADVTGNLSHMVNGLPLSSSHDHNVDFLALKENMVDGCGNLTQELLDSIGFGKPCSCSFCLKELCYPSLLGGPNNMALLEPVTMQWHPCDCGCEEAAHMWMDLTFQETRGRLTELHKSKKHAADQVAKVTQGFSKLSKSTKLEFDLMQNWKSIFIHTQDALAHEIAQTRSDLLGRSKLMENCKRELESRSSVLRDEP